jgi:hypothetical protein
MHSRLRAAALAVVASATALTGAPVVAGVTSDDPVARDAAQASATTRLQLDLDAETFGADAGTRPVIHPRTRVVRDSVEITGHYFTAGKTSNHLRRVSLTIHDRKDRIVLRRVRRDVTTASSLERLFRLDWTARRHGKPLPPGRYEVVLRGVDRLGNRGSDQMRIRVSGDPLRWQERVYDVSPAGSLRDCRTFFRGADECGVFYSSCGEVVASSLYPDGLSYRRRDPGPGLVCPSSTRATGLHHRPCVGQRVSGASRERGSPSRDGRRRRARWTKARFGSCRRPDRGSSRPRRCHSWKPTGRPAPKPLGWPAPSRARGGRTSTADRCHPG